MGSTTPRQGLQYQCPAIVNGKKDAAAAKSLQSCPTLCDPIDSSPPGSPIPGILQARTLEWVAISFSVQKFLWVFLKHLTKSSELTFWPTPYRSWILGLSGLEAQRDSCSCSVGWFATEPSPYWRLNPPLSTTPPPVIVEKHWEFPSQGITRDRHQSIELALSWTLW